MNSPLYFFLATTSGRYQDEPKHMKPFNILRFKEIIDNVKIIARERLLGSGIKEIPELTLYGYNLSHIGKVPDELIRDINYVLIDIAAFHSNGREGLNTLITRKEECERPRVDQIIFNVLFIMNHNKQDDIKNKVMNQFGECRCVISNRGEVNDDTTLIQRLVDFVQNSADRVRLVCEEIAIHVFGDDIPQNKFRMVIDSMRNDDQIKKAIQKNLKDIVEIDAETHRIIKVDDEILFNIIEKRGIKDISENILQVVSNKIDKGEPYLIENMLNITKELAESAAKMWAVSEQEFGDAIESWYKMYIDQNELYDEIADKKFIENRFVGSLARKDKSGYISIMPRSIGKSYWTDLKAGEFAQVDRVEGRLVISPLDKTNIKF